MIKEILFLVLLMRDVFSEFLEKYSMWKIICICVWMVRFIVNCRNFKLRRIKGLLIIDEMKR